MSTLALLISIVRTLSKSSSLTTHASSTARQVTTLTLAAVELVQTLTARSALLTVMNVESVLETTIWILRPTLVSILVQQNPFL